MILGAKDIHNSLSLRHSQKFLWNFRYLRGVRPSNLQAAYDHFNRALFDDLLPGALITLQRKNGMYGYFSRANFVAREQSAGPDDAKQSADEIALNPDVFARVDDTEIMQTLVHEMTHQWQFHFGTPSQRTYHNREWAAKMESIGLMPSSTGEPGGRKTGQHMSDYPIEGGKFETTWLKLQRRGFKIGWESRDSSAPLTVVATPHPNLNTNQKLSHHRAKAKLLSNFLQPSRAPNQR